MYQKNKWNDPGKQKQKQHNSVLKISIVLCIVFVKGSIIVHFLFNKDVVYFVFVNKEVYCILCLK